MLKKQQGFTLLEVLIAVVIISFATLGAVALQLKALKASTEAYLQTQALVIAHDMGERMRANQAGITSRSYHNPTAQDVPACYSTGCTQSEMAQNDMYEWAGSDNADSLIKQLPAASATVCIDSNLDEAPACDGVGNIYAIQISWRLNSEETTQTIITSTFN